MKKLNLVIIGLISMIALSVGCQDIEKNQKRNENQKQQIGQMNQKLKNELSLSESQEKKWDEIHLKYRDEFVALRQDPNESRNEKIEKGKVLAAEMDEESLAILDDSQKEIYNKIMSENRAKVKARLDKRNNNKPGKTSYIQMKNELNLSENQTQKWDAIQNNYKPKFKEIRESGQPGSDETKSEMLVMIEKKNAEILAILNADQQNIYSGFVEERKQMVKHHKSVN
jgi:hypothetical protein